MYFTKQKENGRVVNKFDFLLFPIFYIGNLSFIVTLTQGGYFENAFSILYPLMIEI